jgi:hypothetical protein
MTALSTIETNTQTHVVITDVIKIPMLMDLMTGDGLKDTTEIEQVVFNLENDLNH